MLLYFAWFSLPLFMIFLIYFLPTVCRMTLGAILFALFEVLRRGGAMCDWVSTRLPPKAPAGQLSFWKELIRFIVAFAIVYSWWPSYSYILLLILLLLCVALIPRKIRYF